MATSEPTPAQQPDGGAEGRVEGYVWCARLTTVHKGTLFTLCPPNKHSPIYRAPIPPASPEQPPVEAEGAFEKWIHDDHFGEGCEIGGDTATHSEKCVEAAFNDGYAAGRREGRSAVPTDRHTSDNAHPCCEHDPAKKCCDNYAPVSPERETGDNSYKTASSDELRFDGPNYKERS